MVAFVRMITRPCLAAETHLEQHMHFLTKMLEDPFEAAKCSPNLCTLQLLQDMLQHAVEVEQSVIQPYLSAYYSIHAGASTNASQLLREVVIEEMFHMAAAANVLNAVGGHPSVDGSEYAPEYPMVFSYLNVSLHLAPFTHDQALAFRDIEEAPWGPDFPVHSIGVWYQKIEEVMDFLVSTRGEAYVFTGDAQLQVNFTIGSGTLDAVRTYADAKTALGGIVHQGEGYDSKFWNMSPYTGELEHPHYYRFEEIVKGRFYLPSDETHKDVPMGAALDTDWTAVYSFAPDPKAADFKNSSDIYDKIMTFNSCYSTLLGGLQASFNGAPETFMAQVGTMFMLTGLAKELMATAHPDRPGYMVGLSWEWVNLSDPNVHPCPSMMLNDDVAFIV